MKLLRNEKSVRRLASIFCTVVISSFYVVLSQAEENRTVSRNSKAEVEISDSFKHCENDNDCAFVSTGCDYCCQRQAINKLYLKEYDQKFHKACENYRGAVCNCMLTPANLVCENKLCKVTVKK